MEDRQYRGELALRAGRLGGVVHLVALALAVQYFLVQVVGGAHFRELAENNRLRRVSIDAPRGLIFDSEGRALVENVPAYSVLLDRSLTADVDASLAWLAPILGVSRASLREALADNRGAPRFQPIRLATGLTLEQVARIRVERLEHPELEVAVERLRLYRQAHQTAHVLGYLGEVDASDLKAGYRSGQWIGKRGVEQLYEAHLRGTDGDRVVVVDSRGQQIEEHQRIPALPGRDLTLTLDLDLQQEAARLLDGKAGAVVALDPWTGAVRVMLSAPSFDPNPFARGVRADEWRALIENPDHPLQNRTVQNAYPPGSVFKLVMTVAGLEEGVITSQTRAFCPGWSVIDGHRYRCWRQGGHGSVDLQAALSGSCNVFFHQVGQRLGIDRIARWAKLFGLGRPTGVDLSGERSGLVPSTAWSLEARGSKWFAGETISVATGQGPILVTPLQMAVMVAMVANGGHPIRPYLVDPASGIDPNGVARPPLEVESPADLVAPATFERVRRGMWGVVNGPHGTAGGARLQGVDAEMAGKTGTAQVVRQETWTKNDALAPELRDHAWFGSFAPVDRPRLVIVVFVEHGGGGSLAAAPIARALYEKFLQSDQPHRAAA